MAQAVIGEYAFPGIIDQAVIDGHILLAAAEPVLQILRRDAAHNAEPVISFLWCQAFFIYFSLKRCQFINITASLEIVIRFDALATCPGTAHDRTKGINRHLIKFAVQIFHLFQTGQQGIHGEVMFARIDQSPIDQGIH